MFIAQIFMMYNFWFNIKWNFLWAGGNVFLLANTVYMMQMTVHSSLIVIEMPIWMGSNKWGRWFELILATIYNIAFTGFLTDFLLLLYVYDKTEYGFIAEFESMFFAYNLILHCPIAILNFVVIFKELSLEFIQMTQKRHGNNVNVALGLAEFLDLEHKIQWFFTPDKLNFEKDILLKIIEWTNINRIIKFLVR